MLKKTIPFTDFDGVQQTEVWYFHMSKAEIVEFQLEFGGVEEGGLQKRIQEVIQTKDPKVIMGLFKDMIGRSVGKRSADGKRFMKSEELTKEFMQTEAYSAFFMDLVTNAQSGAEFIRGIVPGDMADKVDVSGLTNLAPTPATPPAPAFDPTKVTALGLPVELSRDERLLAMPLDTLIALKKQQLETQQTGSL